MPRDYYESRRDMAMRRREMRDMARREREMRDGRNPYGSRGQYMSDGHYPMMPYMDYGYGDYAGGEKLSQEELEDWHEDLLQELPEQYKHLFKKEEIEKIARQMNIEFDKFSPLELAVTATMLASDYYESVSPSDIQRYVSMAKQFLCDKDSKLKYGAKLSAYYDSVVNG